MEAPVLEEKVSHEYKESVEILNGFSIVKGTRDALWNAARQHLEAYGKPQDHAIFTVYRNLVDVVLVSAKRPGEEGIVVNPDYIKPARQIDSYRLVKGARSSIWEISRQHIESKMGKDYKPSESEVFTVYRNLVDHSILEPKRS